MQSKDNVARFLSVLAIVAAGATAFYTWSISPYFYAQPSELSYFYHGGNSLTGDKKPKDSYMQVVIHNESNRPARQVTVVLYPVGENFDFECNAKTSTQIGRNRMVVITIDQIAANGLVRIFGTSPVSEYPVANRNGFKHEYIGMVYSVETEFGAVPCEKTSYVNVPHNIHPLPGDERDKSWNPADG